MTIALIQKYIDYTETNKTDDYSYDTKIYRLYRNKKVLQSKYTGDCGWVMWIIYVKCFMAAYSLFAI